MFLYWVRHFSWGSQHGRDFAMYLHCFNIEANGCVDASQRRPVNTLDTVDLLGIVETTSPIYSGSVKDGTRFTN